MNSIKEALDWATQQLEATSESPSLDADVLLSHVTKEDKAFLYGHPESVVRPEEYERFHELVLKRAKGEPIAYLTGEKEFYGKTFRVTKDVLIPRPDTELLVDAVLETFDNNPVTVADIGTGSGAVAIALKYKAPRMNMIATDISKEALAVAQGNAEAHQAEIAFQQGDLLEPIRSKVDGLVANLPYLTDKEVKNPTLQFEPIQALSGGKEGLDAFRKFFIQAPRAIKPDGVVFLEIGHEQARAVSKMAKETFPNARIDVKKDLGGFDRVLIVRLGEIESVKPKAALTGFKHKFLAFGGRR